MNTRNLNNKTIGFTKEYEQWLLRLLNKEAMKLLSKYYAKIYN